MSPITSGVRPTRTTTGQDPTQRAQLRRTLSGAGHHATVLLATHQTEDVAALCERVIVLAGGEARFDGSVVDLVSSAAGQVWLSDQPVPDAAVTWRTGTGRYRVVGGPPPPGAEAAEPTLEDAYLLMLGNEVVARFPSDPSETQGQGGHHELGNVHAG